MLGFLFKSATKHPDLDLDPDLDPEEFMTWIRYFFQLKIT
jgi:hypothetical protein